jgi:hypothetical protein
VKDLTLPWRQAVSIRFTVIFLFVPQCVECAPPSYVAIVVGFTPLDCISVKI